MTRPWFGPCPYCGERMRLGLHPSSWLGAAVGGLVGGLVSIVLAVLRG